MSLTATGAHGTAAPSPPPANPRRRSARPGVRLARIDFRFSPYLYIAPFFLLFGVFGLYPLIYTAWVSLHKWNTVSGDPKFIGFDNYVELFHDADFWNSVYNTLGIFLVSTIPQLLLALVLANVLNRRLRARTALRMGILIPNVTSVAVVGIVFGFIFAREFGLANWLLGMIGVDKIDWQADRWASWTAISVMVDWRWTGYNALIFLAAMQAIPKDLYESAAIDGAGQWRQFWQITLPQLRPTLLFSVIISTIGGLQLFTEPLLFGNGNLRGGSLRQFQTISMYMYQNAFSGNFRYGYGSAVAWTLFLLIVVISVVNLAMVRRSVR